MKVITKIVGLNHQNVAEHELTTLVKYPIQLKREPSNKFDKYAVQCSSGSRMLGYIEAKNSQQVSNFLSTKSPYQVNVKDFDPYSIRVELVFDHKDVEVEFDKLVDGDDAGIYEIGFIYNNDRHCYIGQSANINKRLSSHIRELTKLGHHNSTMQGGWMQNPKAFKYRVLHLVPKHLTGLNRQIYLFEKELYYIEKSACPTANRIAADLVLSTESSQELENIVKEVKTKIKNLRGILIADKERIGQKIIDAGIIKAVKVARSNVTVQASNVLTWLNKTRYGMLEYKPHIDRANSQYQFLVGSLKSQQKRIELVDQQKKFLDEFIKENKHKGKFDVIKMEQVQRFLSVVKEYKST